MPGTQLTAFSANFSDGLSLAKSNEYGYFIFIHRTGVNQIVTCVHITDNVSQLKAIVLVQYTYEAPGRSYNWRTHPQGIRGIRAGTEEKE